MNLIDYTAMENCIKVFRDNIFDSTKRDSIVDEFKEVFIRDLPKQTIDKFNQSQIQELSERVLQSLTVVMEFMDKGIKGLLMGDMSIYMMQSIEATLGKYLNKLNMSSDELEHLITKRKEAMRLYGAIQEAVSPLNESHRNTNIDFKNVYLPDIGIDVPVLGKDAGLSSSTDHPTDIEYMTQKYNTIQKGLNDNIQK